MPVRRSVNARGSGVRAARAPARGWWRWALWSAFGCAACSTSSRDETAEEDVAVVASASGERWHSTVATIAEQYRSWHRVGTAQWALTDCRAPPHPATLRSAAEGGDHAAKLYALYALAPEAYCDEETFTWDPSDLEALAEGLETAPPSSNGLRQAIVKEAWHPTLLEGPVERTLFRPRHEIEPLEEDGCWYAAGDAAGLFMMFQPETAEEPHDEGWVYATVAPDGETITGCGRIASCMACHSALPGRLFGLADVSDPALPRLVPGETGDR